MRGRRRPETAAELSEKDPGGRGRQLGLQLHLQTVCPLTGRKVVEDLDEDSGIVGEEERKEEEEPHLARRPSRSVHLR